MRFCKEAISDWLRQLDADQNDGWVFNFAHGSSSGPLLLLRAPEGLLARDAGVWC
jgi:hypothetical protein